QLFYSEEFTNKTGKVTYVGLVSKDASLDELSNIKNYTFTQEGQANEIVFGDINDGKIDAIDALAAVTSWLRKDEGKLNTKGMVSINVSGDGRINTRDAIDIVDNYVSGKEFKVINK
ncbi:MAG: hypothetical protein ACRC2K_10435, partial [Clostridium sp.]